MLCAASKLNLSSSGTAMQRAAGSAPGGAAAPAGASRGKAAPCAQHRRPSKPSAGSQTAAMPGPEIGEGGWG